LEEKSKKRKEAQVPEEEEPGPVEEEVEWLPVNEQDPSHITA